MNTIRMQRTDKTWVYVAGVSWAPGDGLRVRKVSFTNDPAHAVAFSPAMAQAIAQQFSHRVVQVVGPDGAVAAEQVEVERANASARSARAAVQAEFDEALRIRLEADPALLQAIRKALR